MVQNARIPKFKLAVNRSEKSLVISRRKNDFRRRYTYYHNFKFIFNAKYVKKMITLCTIEFLGYIIENFGLKNKQSDYGTRHQKIPGIS